METHFFLNDEEIRSDLAPGVVVLDFIRQHRKLTGTKIGCREGDCGACTVLVGELNNGRLGYRSMTSCLMPLGNAAGKHIVTIEGLNIDELTPIQRAIVEEGGSQCGFCTVGFVVSLAGFCLSDAPHTQKNGIAAIDGNICRCTGYKSLERAVATLTAELANRNQQDPIEWLVEREFLPKYFRNIPARLQKIQDEADKNPPSEDRAVVGGGTDLFVQKPEEMVERGLTLVFDKKAWKGVQAIEDRIRIGASATAEDLRGDPIINDVFPEMGRYMKLVSSTPIRNMGTIAGNFVNASPIGDLTIFFLAMNATLHLTGGREQPLRRFYLGYKKLDKRPEEHVEALSFPRPGPNFAFNFEKVSKRTHLDIASVNSAIGLTHENGRITEAHVSAGGVAPIPFYLSRTSSFLLGKPIVETTATEAASIAMNEIAPISDARGAAAYKRLLLRQLIYAHFLTLFPEAITLEALV